jgi:hypothetical protein
MLARMVRWTPRTRPVETTWTIPWLGRLLAL